MGSLIPAEVHASIEAYTGSRITGFSFAGGGCINSGGKVTCGGDAYFVKWNDLKRYPGMFEAEVKGLLLLAKSNSLRVPEVIVARNLETYQYLLLEFISEGRPGQTYWRDFGAGLAKMHTMQTEEFGLDHNNYIGSLPQQNNPSRSWIEFFVEERLRAQLRMAIDAGRLERTVSKDFDAVLKNFEVLVPEEPPSLLHGDLWGGNLMTSADGRPCLIDPAVYYGHREVDLAMTQLFGGFDASYFAHYNDAYPLARGYEERFDLYNLYPLLVHVNLFGAGYTSQVRRILNKFL